MRGKYIVIEGADGTGKSTQVDLLVHYLNEKGIKAITTQEPGGVPTAERLRSIIKDGTLARDPWSNVMLFTTSRRISWLQTIEPTLAEGTWVVASRNYISTIAYQGYGEGLDVQRIVDFTRENVGEDYMNPDQVIILTLSDESARKTRIDGRENEHELDTFEAKPDDFQAAMQAGYVAFAHEHGITTVDAERSIDQIQQELRSLVVID